MATVSTLITHATSSDDDDDEVEGHRRHQQQQQQQQQQMTPSTVETTGTTSSSDYEKGGTMDTHTSSQQERSVSLPQQQQQQQQQLKATSSSSSLLMEETTEVCCGCRPKRRRYRKRNGSNSTTTRKQQSSSTNTANDNRKHHHRHRHRFSVARLLFWKRNRNGYFDADMGVESEWRALERHVQYEDHSDASQYFFDAVDLPLGDDEYPIDDGYVIKSGAELLGGDYPIVFTTSLQHPAPTFEEHNPTSWLRKSLKVWTTASADSDAQAVDEGEEEDSTAEMMEDANDDVPELLSERRRRRRRPTSTNRTEKKQSSPVVVQRRDSHWSTATRDTIQSHKEPSMRFLKIQQRTPSFHKIHLEEPRVKSRGLQGYPGELTVEEMEECQTFLKGLAELPSEVSEQVFSFRDVEEEPYAICRWLRATKFNAQEILDRLADNQPMFDNAKMEEFYPDVAEAIGAPLSVFLSQYPFLPVGRGKNGCPVNYFLAGRINPEGMLCMTTIKKLEYYFWYSFMWKFKNEVRSAQTFDPDFVRLEGINIVELDGLSSSALSSETMEVIKLASKISDFFPETLHCMLVLNAPGFFAMAWGLIKKFIDSRTAARIQLFSNKDRGQKALEKLIDKSQIPSDYGGDNVSLSEAFLKEAHDPSLIRQEIELVHCKRRSKSHTKTWTLQNHESLYITVYTRSVSTGRVSIQVNGQTFVSFDAKCRIQGEAGGGGGVSDGERQGDLFDDEEEPGTPLPFSKMANKAVMGPGKVTVDLDDLDDAPKQHSGKSKGYFLIVGDVKNKSSSESKATVKVVVKPAVAKLQQQQKMAVTMAGLTSSTPTSSSKEGNGKFKKVRLQ